MDRHAIVKGIVERSIMGGEGDGDNEAAAEVTSGNLTAAGEAGWKKPTWVSVNPL